jgi:hypothetical protein
MCRSHCGNLILSEPQSVLGLLLSVADTGIVRVLCRMLVAFHKGFVLAKKVYLSRPLKGGKMRRPGAVST